MPSVLDVLLLALLVIFAVRCYRRGLVRSLIGIGRLILAVLLTVALSSPVAGLLEERIVEPSVRERVGERLSALAACTEGGVAELYEAIPSPLRAHLTKEDTTPWDVEVAVTRWTDRISHTVSHALASLLATVLVFLVAFVMLPWVLRLLSRLIRAIPLIAGLDRLLGLSLGLLGGIAAVALVSRVLFPLLVAVGRPEWVETSHILHLFGGT